MIHILEKTSSMKVLLPTFYQCAYTLFLPTLQTQNIIIFVSFLCICLSMGAVIVNT